MGLNKAHPQHFINMGLLTLIFFQKTDDRGYTAAHKHWVPLSGPMKLYLVTWKDAITGK